MEGSAGSPGIMHSSYELVFLEFSSVDRFKYYKSNMCIWELPEEKRLCKYCTLTDCKERKTKWGKLSALIRKLEAGQQIRLEQEQYASCKTVAYRMSKQFNKKFSLRKKGKWVIVERLF